MNEHLDVDTVSGENRTADDLTARRLAALAHPARLAIVRRLSCCEGCCVKDLVPTAGLAQSTVSQHLKSLVESGLVTYRPNRQASCYRLDRDAFRMLSVDVDALLCRCCGENSDTLS